MCNFFLHAIIPSTSLKKSSHLYRILLSFIIRQSMLVLSTHAPECGMFGQESEEWNFEVTESVVCIFFPLHYHSFLGLSIYIPNFLSKHPSRSQDYPFSGQWQPITQRPSPVQCRVLRQRRHFLWCISPLWWKAHRLEVHTVVSLVLYSLSPVEGLLG